MLVPVPDPEGRIFGNGIGNGIGIESESKRAGRSARP